MGTANATEGFLYLATGEECRRFVLTSVKMLRMVYPETPCHVISDQPMQGTFTNTVVAGAKPEYKARDLKTQLHRFTPFDVSTFIDADACVLKYFGGMAAVLGDAALAIADAEPSNTNLYAMIKNLPIGWLSREEFETLKQLNETGYNAPHYNSGFMIFHRHRVAKLFDVWHEEWTRFRGPDEGALTRANLRVPIAIQCLPKVFNWRASIDPGRPPVVFHGFKNRRKVKSVPGLTVAHMERVKQLLRRLPVDSPRIAEIGCLRGRMSRELLSREDLSLVMVDSWCLHGPECAYARSKDSAVLALNGDPDGVYLDALRATMFAADPHRKTPNQ